MTIKKYNILLLTDIGSDIDDVLALYCLLGCEEEINLLGVVISGGSHAKRGFLTQQLLLKLNKSHIPVIMPNHGDNMVSSHDFSMPDEFEMQEVQQFSDCDHDLTSSQYIIDTVNKYYGSIFVVAIGPLTALSHAIKMDTNFSRGIARFYIQGQVLTCYDTELKPNTDASYNLREDKEAAHIVFENLQHNRVPFVCLGKYAAYQIPLPKTLFEEWSIQQGTPINILLYAKKALNVMWKKDPDLVYRIYQIPEDHSFEHKWLDWLSYLSYPYDPLLVASIVRPDLFCPQLITINGVQHWLIGNESQHAGVSDPDAVRQFLQVTVSKGSSSLSRDNYSRSRNLLLCFALSFTLALNMNIK